MSLCTSSTFRCAVPSCHMFIMSGCFFFVFATARTKTPKILSVRQDKHFVFAKAGDSLTLQCFYENIVDTRFYWYRQNLGQNPRLVSSYYKYEMNATFHNEFRNNPRFELETTKGKNHLKIRDLKISDSAVYFCASSYLYRLDFAEGTMVYVEQTGSKLQTSVDQSASETLRPGGSVTLNCTVQTGTCGGEHSVYWFKNSEYSEPGLIHSKGGENKLCKNTSSSRTHSCVYKLPISKLDASHAGTYYCAVASCGHILFGKGTKLDLKGEPMQNKTKMTYFNLNRKFMLLCFCRYQQLGD